MSTGVDLALVIVAIAVIIMLHELGHLIVAKACGMKVVEYFVGFGPRLWSFRRGGTEYGVKAILAGGYVKIPGMSNLEEVEEAEESTTYRNASFPRKIAVVSAGSAMHFVIAISLLWILFSFVGMPATGQVSVQGFSRPAGATDPARAAGLKPADVIVSVSGHTVTSYDQLTRLISPSAGRPLTLVVERKGRRIRTVVTPVSNGGKGRIGIAVGQPTVTVDPIVAVPRSFGWIGSYVSQAAGSLGGFFANTWTALTNPSVTANSRINEQRPMSIVGAARLATEAAQAGIQPVLLIFVMLNIFIGIFNLLPLPILDGGHVGVAVYERIRSRRGRSAYHADYAKLVPLMYAMLVVLIALGGSLVYLDVVKPVRFPFR